MKKQYLLPGVAVVGGILGCILRRWELATAFDPETGLVVGGTATPALIGLSAVMFLLLALLARGDYAKVGDCDTAFAAQGQTLYLTLMIVAGFAMVAAGAINLATTPTAYQALVMKAASTQSQVRASALIPRAATGLGALLGGLGLVQMGKRNAKGESGNQYCLAVLLPAFTACFFLITVYQTRSGDPIVLDYAYELLATAACVVGAYTLAGFSFQNGRGWVTVFSGSLSIYLVLTTLADQHEGYQTLLLLALAVYFLASVYQLLQNSQYTPTRVIIDTDENIDREAPPHES